MSILVEQSDLPSVLANHGYFSNYPVYAPVQDSGGQVYNVKFFGAVGNNINDDTSAISSAINAASAAGGGTVFLPPGTYKVTSTIIPLSGVRIQGAGNSTVIAGYGSQFSIFQNIASTNSPTTDIEICDLKIDGTNVTAAAYTPLYKGIYIQYTKRLKIHDIYVYNTYATGIGTDYLVDSVISRCVVEQCGVRGIAAGGATGSNGIGIGTGAYATESWIVADCIANNCGNNGIMCEAQNPTINSEYMMMVNCESYNCKNGYLNSGVTRVIFSNCWTWGNSNNGFYVDTGDVGSSSNFNPSEVYYFGCRAFNNGSAGNFDGFIYNDTLVSSQKTLTYELTYVDCISAFNTNNGFQIKDCAKVSMTGCRAYNNYNHGILAFSDNPLMPFNDLSISGGSFYNNSTINPNQKDGIRIGSSGTGTMNHASVRGTRCYDDNARSVTDGAMSATSQTLTSATAGFRLTDVGKSITVNGAAAAGGNLTTTIIGVSSPTQVTLQTAASTTVSGATVNWGSATQRYGISIAGTTNTTNITIEGNDLYGNATSSFNTGAISTLVVRNNTGYNPIGQSSITVTASPFTYTAGNSPEDVFINGGTVSAIAKGGTTLASSSPAMVHLEPNQSVTVTYTVAPTMVTDKY